VKNGLSSIASIGVKRHIDFEGNQKSNGSARKLDKNKKIKKERSRSREILKSEISARSRSRENP
jgi:hypothetical protein